MPKDVKDHQTTADFNYTHLSQKTRNTKGAQTPVIQGPINSHSTEPRTITCVLITQQEQGVLVQELPTKYKNMSRHATMIMN